MTLKQPKFTEKWRNTLKPTPGGMPDIRASPPAVPPQGSLHAEVVDATKGAIKAARQSGLAQGYPAAMLLGFVWDLADPMLPAPIQNSPMAQAARQKTPPNQMALQAGVLTRDEMFQLLTPLGYQLEKREPPTLLSADHTEPALITQLRTWREEGYMPVVIIAGRRLSVRAIEVPSLLLPP